MAQVKMQKGERMVWLTGAALSITLLSTVVLLAVITSNGIGYFWPANVALVHLADGKTAMGEIAHALYDDAGKLRRIQVKVGNRDLYGADFRWIDGKDVDRIEYPPEASVLERQEFGNFYGSPRTLTLRSIDVPAGGSDWERLLAAVKALAARRGEVNAIAGRMTTLNLRLEDLRLGILKLHYNGGPDEAKRIAALDSERGTVRQKFDAESERMSALVSELRASSATFADSAGQTKEIPILAIMRPYQPNTMSVWAKSAFYLDKIRELLWEEPRESNTEGGVFPAIFGTVSLVLVMSLFSIPLGVIAAVYLQEYAKDGPLLRMVRIAVFNLSGVPSIVYGIFGLGFFIYGIGGALDQVFFPERLPTPVFGTGGILWASLTLALLTVPVVIVATEEALASIPRGIREASLSLGATKFQTLLRVLLPMAAPGIITGFVLAMARAAGEVAPLMITGVVKLAPALPIDGQFPFVHLDRKFMHLGFHIYDVGFQSPNVEAAKPMVFITTMLLVAIVVLLSLTAIILRNNMQKRYATKTF
jgi:phosphate transport system permease protein